MSYATAFVIGAVIGCASLVGCLVKRPIYGGHPMHGLIAALMGGVVAGTIIWLVANMFP